MKRVARVGGKALLYFEVVSTFALIIGVIVVNVVRPGAGFNVDPRFILHIIPSTLLDAFTGSGDLLQVLFVAVPSILQILQAFLIFLTFTGWSITSHASPCFL